MSEDEKERKPFHVNLESFKTVGWMLYADYMEWLQQVLEEGAAEEMKRLKRKEGVLWLR